MAINDFTGQNIKDTYQRVVQTDGTNVTDGTGSLLPISFDGNNVVISGSLLATEYIVTSSVTNVIFQQQSGSTIFGDSTDDVHQFTGSVSMSKNLHVVGDISASNVKVDATTLTIGNQPLTQADLSNLKVGKSIISDESTLTVSTIDSEDNVSNSSNYIRPQMWIHNSDAESALIHNTAHSLHFRTAGGDPFRIFTDDNTNNFVRLGTFAGSNIILRGNVTASGDISSSGAITTAELKGVGTSTGFHVDGFISSSHITASGDISASGNIHGDTYTIDANATLATRHGSGQLSLGNVNDKLILNSNGQTLIVGPITASGNISASGTIHAEHIRSVDDIEVKDRIMMTDNNNVKIDFSTSQIDFYSSVTAQHQFHSQKTTFNLSGINIDFNVKGNSDDNLIYADAGEDKVAIGTNILSEKLTVEGNISASGKIYSSNKEVFQNTFQCEGDSSFATSAYGPNTQGLNFYFWNRNWTDTTSDGGNPTGDGIHRVELNSGWHVPYDIRIISFSGGITDPGNTNTDNKSASLGLWVSSNPIGFEDYTTNNNDTKNFLCSGSVLINGNRWKAFKNYTSSYDLSEGQVVFPRIKMEKEYENLRGQFTIHYVRRK